MQVESDDGYSRVRPCECIQVRKAERLLNKSGLKEAIETQTFGNFNADTALQKTLKSTAGKYLVALIGATGKKPWFYVGGNPGSGKTHICTAICGELLKNGIGVRYMQWVDEVARLKAFVTEPDFENLVEEYIECPVLYIDDLFKQTYRENPVIKDADIKMAFTILNARYIQNKATIISCEWNIYQLINADEGVFSRVYERSKGYTIVIPRDKRNNFRLMEAMHDNNAVRGAGDQEEPQPDGDSWW